MSNSSHNLVNSNVLQLGNKESILNDAKAADLSEVNAARPKAMASAPLETPMSQMNLDNTVFAFTKIMWLNTSKDVMQALVTDPLGKDAFEKFCKTTSTLYQNHFDFLCKFALVANATVSHLILIYNHELSESIILISHLISNVLYLFLSFLGNAAS